MRVREMMGNRGHMDGEECDALSHRSRPMLSWRRGQLRLIKRRYRKRERKTAKRAARESTR